MKFKKRVKKLAKAAVKTYKVAKAARGVAKRLGPLKTAKMLKNAHDGKGLVFPGSNYIGPGNAMDKKVRSKGDALAKKHDLEYGRYHSAGFKNKRVYMGYSDADKRLQKASDVTTPEGLVTYTGMKAKQVMHKLGLTGKRLRDKELRAKERAQK